mmetsp:Transcript_16131/g.38560  ORF Transcript_16131/g.38560 Transcript_16131/m.38560 type:complete len:228 (-) Transcript_16131:3384-4067(-)
MLAKGLQNEKDEARRQPGSRHFLGDPEPATPLRHDTRVGQQLRVRLQQRQPQSALRNDGLRGSHLAQDPDLPGGVLAEGGRVEAAERDDQGDDGTGLPPCGRRRPEAVREPGAADSDGVGQHDLHQDRQQVEHDPHRPHDLLQRGRHPHGAAPRPPRQVREQDPDANQDRPQLQDALALPAGGLLHAQGAGRAGDAVDGPHSHPAERPPLQQADRDGHHPLQGGHEP